MELQTVLFHAHSGLRYLVLVVAVIALAVLVRGYAASLPYAGGSRASVAIFVGTLHLQVLLGLALLLVRPLYPALAGHIVMLFAAVAVAQAAAIVARKQADPRRAHALGLAGIALALALIVGGIMAIRPHPLFSTPTAAVQAVPAR